MDFKFGSLYTVFQGPLNDEDEEVYTSRVDETASHRKYLVASQYLVSILNLPVQDWCQACRKKAKSLVSHSIIWRLKDRLQCAFFSGAWLFWPLLYLWVSHKIKCFDEFRVARTWITSLLQEGLAPLYISLEAWCRTVRRFCTLPECLCWGSLILLPWACTLLVLKVRFEHFLTIAQRRWL